MIALIPLLLSLAAGTPPPASRAAAPVKVVTSLTTYASIAREIVGDHGIVSSIAVGDEKSLGNRWPLCLFALCERPAWACWRWPAMPRRGRSLDRGRQPVPEW